MTSPGAEPDGGNVNRSGSGTGSGKRQPIHATCVLIGGNGVLLRGPSGAGKSDLALRLIDRGAELVADDQVLLDLRPVDPEKPVSDGPETGTAGPTLWACAPEPIAGQMEVRGVGLISVPIAREAPVIAVFDLAGPDQVPRLPEKRMVSLVPGHSLPLWTVDPMEPSAPLKIMLLADACTIGRRIPLA